MKRHSFYQIVPWLAWTAVGFSGVGWLVGVIGIAAITLWFFGGLKYGEELW